jgi:hypothetical protein
MTKRLPSPRATAVITTKMINTQHEFRPRRATAGGACRLLGGAVGAQATPVCLGGPEALGEQPSRNRVDDHRWPSHPARHSLLINELLPGQQLVLIIVTAGGGPTGCSC